MATDGKLVKVRVMAAPESAEAVAQTISDALQEYGYDVLELSKPYPCKAPMDDQSRVYVTALRRQADGVYANEED